MNTDWSQFWPSMIATFVGFVLALLGQWGANKLHDYFQRRNLKNRIKQELEMIKEQLKSLPQKFLDVQPLKTPTWEEAISSGQISILPDELRANLFRLYSLIQEFNAWSRVQANYFFANKNQHNEMLADVLIKLKDKLLSTEESINLSIQL